MTPNARGAALLARASMRLLVACTLASAALSALPSAALHAADEDPEPFRGDEIDGRDFDYDSESFLDRVSNRFKPEFEREWRETRAGFRGTAGSVGTKEFYVFEELRKRVTLEGPVFFSFHHKRAEDFDTRYDRNLAGLGLRSESGWAAAVEADVVAEKGEIDVNLTGEYRSSEGNEARAVVVLVDAPRGKSTEFEYQTAGPLTLFADGRLQIGAAASVYGWVNSNLPLRREQLLDGYEFRYWQDHGGLRGEWRASERWFLSAGGGALLTDRARRVSTAAPEVEQEFRRSSDHLEAECEYRIDERLSAWIGLRRFRLDEHDVRPLALPLSSNVTRREWILHFGAQWQITERFATWPGIYLAFIDNREEFPYAATAPDDDEGIESKLVLPLDVRFERGVISLGISIQLDTPRFGGGNVQMVIPF